MVPGPFHFHHDVPYIKIECPFPSIVPLFKQHDVKLTVGSLSPPTRAFTAPSFKDIMRILELSLSAMKRKLMLSKHAEARPDGWANPARWG
jgi:hypothetical protein